MHLFNQNHVLDIYDLYSFRNFEIYRKIHKKKSLIVLNNLFNDTAATGLHSRGTLKGQLTTEKKGSVKK